MGDSEGVSMSLLGDVAAVALLLASAINMGHAQRVGGWPETALVMILGASGWWVFQSLKSGRAK